MVYCLLLSLLIGKVWAALMHCLPYLIIFRSPQMQRWSLISFNTTLVQPSIEWVTASGLLFKLKSIGVGGSVLSICTEFLSDRRQRVVVDGTASEWIPTISGMPQGSVLGLLLFIIYTSETFELVENRLFAYTDDSTLLAVVAALTGTWLGFRSGAITGARYWILTKLRM